MSARQFSFSIRPDVVAGSTVIEQIAAAMPPGTYSYQLPDPAWRWLGESHPARPAGNQTFNEAVDHWGLETTATIRDVDGSGRRWHETYNSTQAGNRQALCGLGGPTQSEWDSIGREWWHVAGVTGSADYSQTLMRYQAATDTFVHYTGRATADDTVTVWPTRGGAHNFSRSALDPQRRILYVVIGRAQNTDWAINPATGTKPVTGQGSDVTVVGASLAGANSDPANRAWLSVLPYYTDPASWWESPYDIPSTLAWPQARFIPNRGAMGSLFCLFVNGVRSVTPKVFDIATQTWNSVGWSSSFPSPPAGNDPVNDNTPFIPRFPATIYLDGYYYIASLVDGQNEFWRIPMPASGAIPPPEKNLAPCPVPMDASGYGTGTHTSLAVLNGKIYAFHNDTQWDMANPVRDGGIWAYTPDAGPGRWDRVGDIWDESLATLLATQGTSILAPANPTRPGYQCTVAAVPEDGVFFIVWQPYGNEAVGFLWKPPA